MTKLDLEITRLIAAPRAKVWRAFADPKILVQWWCPKPWTTEVLAFDMRPGGFCHMVMRAPEGEEGVSDNPGCFLEVVPQERLAFTSVLGGGWRPIATWMPMTAIFEMKDEGAGTRYTARALHLNEADSRKHEEMGFYDGWGTCARQLEEVAKGL